MDARVAAQRHDDARRSAVEHHLPGLAGKPAVTIADGKHSCDVEYALPDAS